FHIFNAALLLSLSLSAVATTQVASQKIAPKANVAQVPSQQNIKAQLKWTTDVAELKKAESVFVDSFFEVYSKIPLANFGNIKAEVDTKAGHDAAIKKFLNKAFSEQIVALGKNAVECVIAYVDGK